MKARALLLAACVSVMGVISVGAAPPAAASEDFPPYSDCASALSAASGGTGRLACFDKVTAYGPIFQVFSNWSLYYAAPFNDLTPINHPNHLWYGSEWRPEWQWSPLGTPGNGRTRGLGTGATPEQRKQFRTYNIQPPTYAIHQAWSTDPGLLSWWYYAAADPSLNALWITR